MWHFMLVWQANEKLNAAKKSVNVLEQEKLIADALDVSRYCLSQLVHVYEAAVTIAIRLRFGFDSTAT